jgi:hypothetical protein
MCRNIKTLFNFDPPATEEEIHAATLQFARKVAGFKTPSKVNQVAFDKAVGEMSLVVKDFLDSLVTTADPHNREVEAERAKVRSQKRFGNKSGII